MYTITNKMYLFGNVFVLKLRTGDSGTLTLDTVYADHENQRVVFYDVLYNELNESLLGKRMSVVVELPLEEMEQNISRDVLEFVSKLLLNGESQGKLGMQLENEGYHVYQWCEEHGGEYYTIAKSVEIK